MKNHLIVLIFFFSTSLFAQHLSQMNFTFYNETDVTGFGFGIVERDLDDISFATEIRLDLVTPTTDNSETQIDFVLALGAFYNLSFSSDQTIVPFVGGLTGAGFSYGDKAAEDYAPDEETFQANLEAGESPVAEGLYLYYNLAIGVDWFLFGRDQYSAAGLNITYNIGNYNRISVGFTTPFSIIEAIL